MEKTNRNIVIEFVKEENLVFLICEVKVNMMQSSLSITEKL